MSVQAQAAQPDDITAYLQEAGWGDATVLLLGADAGLRRYFSLSRGDEKALLMDMSRAGYEADLKAYVDKAGFLKRAGIRVPEIYHYDLKKGLSVIENLGEESFGDAVRRGEDKAALYRQATDVLITIRDKGKENDLGLGGYNQTLIRERLKQFVDYYMPAVTGTMATPAHHEEFQAVLAEIEEAAADCPACFCHADYHLENLIWRPDTEEKYGLIDFQDGFWGPMPYDLLNLLEDARQTVPENIKEEMKARYCAGITPEAREAFDQWYVILSAHFHCRVAGLFIMLAKERNMRQYLEHIPRLQAYIKKEIEHPVLAPLKAWIERHNIQLDTPPVI
jgi:hypothetical protein